MTTTNSEQVVRECAFDIMNIVNKHKDDNAGLMKASIDGFDLGSKPEDVQKLVEFIQGVK